MIEICLIVFVVVAFISISLHRHNYCHIHRQIKGESFAPLFTSAEWLVGQGIDLFFRSIDEDVDSSRPSASPSSIGGGSFALVARRDPYMVVPFLCHSGYVYHSYTALHKSDFREVITTDDKNNIRKKWSSEGWRNKIYSIMMQP